MEPIVDKRSVDLDVCLTTKVNIVTKSLHIFFHHASIETKEPNDIQTISSSDDYHCYGKS